MPKSQTKPASPSCSPSAAADLNLLVADLRRAVQRGDVGIFSFNIELGQVRTGEYLYRAYVSTDGRVREASGLTHVEPADAVSELCAKLEGKF